MRRMTGVLVLGVFGVGWVMAGAGAALLNPMFSILLRVLAVLAFCGLIILARRAVALQPADQAAPAPLGRAYWLVVLGEVVLIFGGIVGLRLLDQPGEAIIAWVAFAVGIHFFGLIPAMKAPGYLVPGVILTLLGIAGLVMAQTSAVAWVPIVSGLLSGATILTRAAVMAWPGRSEQS